MSALVSKARLLAAAALTFGACAGANASTLLGQDPDASAIVDAGGLEWVYASPCAGDGSGCGAAVELHHGFTFATAEQWNASFSSLSALVSAFTAPNGSTLCGSTYFSPNYDHCDIGDVAAGYVFGAPFALYPTNGYSETFLVRGSSVVPEPSTYAMMALGLGALALVRRRKA